MSENIDRETQSQAGTNGAHTSIGAADIRATRETPGGSVRGRSEVASDDEGTDGAPTPTVGRSLSPTAVPAPAEGQELSSANVDAADRRRLALKRELLDEKKRDPRCKSDDFKRLRAEYDDASLQLKKAREDLSTATQLARNSAGSLKRTRESSETEGGGEAREWSPLFARASTSTSGTARGGSVARRTVARDARCLECRARGLTCKVPPKKTACTPCRQKRVKCSLNEVELVFPPLVFGEPVLDEPVLGEPSTKRARVDSEKVRAVKVEKADAKGAKKARGPAGKVTKKRVARAVSISIRRALGSIRREPEVPGEWDLGEVGFDPDFKKEMDAQSIGDQITMVNDWYAVGLRDIALQKALLTASEERKRERLELELVSYANHRREVLERELKDERELALEYQEFILEWARRARVDLKAKAEAEANEFVESFENGEDDANSE